jgi:hypothetical protein
MKAAASPQPSTSSSAALIEEITAEFPRFEIAPKRGSRLCRWIDLALKLVTLGGQRAFMTRYHTVIGDTLYVPLSWTSMTDVDRIILLRHERVHLRQRRRLTFGGLAFVYLVPWLPLGLAYGRARLEWEAYTETLRATAELKGINVARSDGLRAQIVARFTGPDYGWMWPFPASVRRWYADALAAIEAEIATSRPEDPHLGPERQ